MVESRALILSGWKDIANYLGKGVRTVQRYEREFKLPVHRPAGKYKGSVIATKADLDNWLSARPTPIPLGSTESKRALSDVLYAFQENIAELARLREESVESRTALARSREALKETLSSVRNNIQAKQKRVS